MKDLELKLNLYLHFLLENDFNYTLNFINFNFTHKTYIAYMALVMTKTFAINFINNYTAISGFRFD